MRTIARHLTWTARVKDVPGYLLEEQVGQGGFGVVYRAFGERQQREVAIKVLTADDAGGVVTDRVAEECGLAARLAGHPNVVTAIDSGRTRSGLAYIVMEYFPHGSLKDRLASDGPLSPAKVLRIGVKIAGALAAAHEAGLLHGDVKPANILISRYGEPALADFGAGRMLDNSDTADGPQMLSLSHVAPEVLARGERGAQADVYSLGLTLYQLLTGRLPARGQMLPAHTVPGIRDRRPLDVPPEILDVLDCAMSRVPEDRFASASAFAAALRQLQADLGLPVTDVSAVANDYPRLRSDPAWADEPDETVDGRRRAVPRAASARIARTSAWDRVPRTALILALAAAIGAGMTVALVRWHPRPARSLATVAVGSHPSRSAVRVNSRPPTATRATAPARATASATARTPSASAAPAQPRPITAPPQPKPTTAQAAAPTAVPIPLDAACQWAYPGQATGAISGSGFNIVCLDANGQSLGGFPDGSGHSLNDWCADPSHTQGYQLPQAHLAATGWVCTLIS